MIYRVVLRFICLLLRGVVMIAATMAAGAQHPTWQPIALPPGGFISSFTVDHDGRLFVATDKGLQRSTDAGSTWAYIYPETTPGVIPGGEFFVSEDPSVGIVLSGSNLSITLSADHGATWRYVRAYIDAPRRTLALPNGTIIGSDSMLQQLSWEPDSSAAKWVGIMTDKVDRLTNERLVLTRRGTVYANGTGLVLRSRDSGVTWTELSFGLPVSLLTRSIVELSNGVLVLASTSGFYRSVDDGKHWSPIDIHNDLLLKCAATGKIILLEGLDNRIVAAACNRIFVSDDDGSSWHLTDEAFPTDDARHIVEPAIRDIVIAPDGRIYAGYDYGGMRVSSDNGESWSDLSRSFTGFTSYYSFLGAGGRGAIYLENYLHMILRSNDRGASWKRLPGTIRPVLAFGPGDEVFAGAGGSGIDHADMLMHSTDGGDTWERLPDPGRGSFGVLAFRDGNLFLGTDTAGIYRSSDRGASWTRCGLIPKQHDWGEEGARSITLGRDGVVYAVVCDRREISSWTSSFRSTDNGATWSSFGSGEHLQRYITLAPSGTLFEVSYFSIRRSTDDGRTFVEVGGGDRFLYRGTDPDLVVNERGVAFMATDNGVFRSDDDGASWTPENQGIEGRYIGEKNSLVLDRDGYLYLAAGSELYRSYLPTLGVDREEARSSTMLHAQPNPFTNATSVRCVLPERGAIEIDVIDMTGARVARMAEGIYEAGEHRFSWDAADAPDGVYTLVLRLGGGVETVKLVVRH